MRFAIFLLMIATIGCISIAPAPPAPPAVNSYEDCLDHGYPVFESYPRQCQTPDGRNFVSTKDVFDIGRTTTCQEDGDCVLADEAIGLSCCSACAVPDYSDPRWVAVSRSWFESTSRLYCRQNCTKACALPAKADYSARCAWGICVKTPQGGNPTKIRCCEEYSKSKPGISVSEICQDYFELDPTAISECS